MKEKIKKIFPMDEEIGLRIGLYSFFISLFGGIIYFISNLNVLGYAITAIGGLGVFVGVAMHFIVNWKNIFSQHK